MATPRDHFFSLLRQEYPPILTSGEMLSHPGGWDKPIPEVIHLWRHRTSTPNNPEKWRLGCVLDIFCTFLGKNEKNNQTPHWGRDSGISKPRRGLQIFDTWMGFPRPSLNVVLDSISPSSVCPSVRPSVCLSDRLSHFVCHTFQSYVSQATHAFLGMLPLFFLNLTSLLCLLNRWRCSVEEPFPIWNSWSEPAVHGVPWCRLLYTQSPHRVQLLHQKRVRRKMRCIHYAVYSSYH